MPESERTPLSVWVDERAPAQRQCFDSSGSATSACTVVPPSPSVAVARSFTRVEYAHASRAVFRRAWSAPAPRGPVRHETRDDKMSTLAAIAAPFAGEAVAARRRAPSRARAARSARCAASEEVRSQPSIPSRLSPPPGPPPRAPHPADHVIRHTFAHALTIAIFSRTRNRMYKQRDAAPSATLSRRGLGAAAAALALGCLLYTSPSPRDRTRSRMPSSA